MSKKKLIIAIIIELIIIGCVGMFMLKKIPPREVLSPDLSAWESRYSSFADGVWHVDEETFPSEEAGEEEVDLIYGPYMTLPAGSYSISVDYSCDEDQTFEVYSANAGNRILIHEDEIIGSGSQSVTYHFTLAGTVDDLEVRVHYNGSGTVDIKNINIVPSTFLLREVLLWLLALAFLLDVCLLVIWGDGADNGSHADGSRKVWVDICRGLGILLVLLGHVDPPFKWLIFGFHIPLFFILSGYLYNDTDDTRSYLSRNFRRYIVPYFALCGVNLVITLIRTALEDVVTREWVIRYVKGIIYCDEWLPNCLPLWFLPALFVTMTAMHFLHRTDSISLRCIVILACSGAAILMDRLGCPDLPWCMGQAVMGLVFAETGYLIRKHSVIDRIAAARTVDKAGVLIVLAVCGYNAILLNHESIEAIVSMRSMRYGHFPLWMAGAVFVSVFLMGGLASIAKPGSGSSVILSPLAALGRHTIIFFAFDFCMGVIATDILQIVLGIDPWYFTFVIKFILLIVLFAVWYLMRGRKNSSGA